MKKHARALTVMVCLTATATLVFVRDRLSRQAPRCDLDALPLSFGDWEGSQYVVEEHVKSVLETEFIISREYRNRGGFPVHLSIVYYPDSKIGFHRPESCNIGSGGPILGRDRPVMPVTLSGGSPQPFMPTRLTIGGEHGRSILLYFYVSGEYVTGDYVQFRLHMMGEQLRFRVPSGAQIQLRCAAGASDDAVMQALEDFLRRLLPLLPRCVS